MTQLLIISDVSLSKHVSDNFYLLLYHVAPNLLANLFSMWCDKWHDESFKQAAHRLGKPMSALVASSND